MKKILLILLFFVGSNFVMAQQLSTFYDATSNNAGFSYNITISYKLIKGWSKARPSEIYSVKLVSVTTDSRGFYYGNQRNKYYSCSEIGNNCNPNNWQQVYIGLNGQCKTSVNKKLSFSRINEETTIESWIEENGACTFDNIEGNVRQDGTRNIMNIIDAKENSSEKKDSQNNNTSNNNPTTKTNTEQNQENGTPNYTTAKPLDNYDANTGLYSNPMTNSSNGSSYDKDLQRAELIVDVANGILDLLGPSPEKKARQQKEEINRVNAKANLELVALNKVKEKERLENEIKEAEKRKEENEKRKYEFINNFGKSEMPVSSTKAINNEVYFFFYFKEFDSNAPLNVSNVFPWGKYADGTWPNKDKLNSDKQKLFHSYYPTISGYYTTRKEAEGKLQEFVERAKQYGISLKTVTFKGIEATTTNTDFWGNPVKSN